ncbi:MAG: M67 family metallopeptidase [Actinobacteria bacterium]|nr:M67 family metallopeptidase [Actinomycetota bacterium]
MIELPRSFADEIVEHARQERPNEACGLIAAKEGVPVRLIRMRNADQSPVTFRLDPKEQLRAFDEMDEQGWDLFAIYHSHTQTDAYPSPTDRRLAFYPEAAYLIVSLADPDGPVIRGFRILDHEVTEEDVRVG